MRAAFVSGEQWPGSRVPASEKQREGLAKGTSSNRRRELPGDRRRRETDVGRGKAAGSRILRAREMAFVCSKAGLAPGGVAAVRENERDASKERVWFPARFREVGAETAGCV